MDEFYNGPKKQKRGAGRVLISIFVVLAVLATAAIAGIGIYKLMQEEQPAPVESSVIEQEQSTVQQEQTEEQEEQELPERSELSEQQVGGVQDYIADLLPEEVAEKVIPSVVCIQNYQQEKQMLPFAQLGGQEPQLILAAEGSGVIYTQDGYIITNAHVVKGSSLIKVVLSDDRVCEAKLVGMDEDTDLALIKIEETGLTPIEIGDYEELKVGEFVMAVGNPGGLEFSSSVTFGIVSAKDRPMDIDSGYTVSTIQTDAAINPGNSGGALVNMKGQLIGINSAKYVATGYEGLGFSITVQETLPIVEDLKEHGKVTGRSRLGVTGMVIDELVAAHYNLKPGFYVSSVENPQAGTLQAGDVITAVEGVEVTSDTVIKNILNGKAPGTQISVRFWRNGAYMDTALTLISADE